MLTLLTGIHPNRKREYITEKIADYIKNGKKVILLVPEQSSFDRGRDFLLRYGEVIANRLKVRGISELVADITEENGLSRLNTADETAKAVLMSLAVEETSEIAPLFSKYASRLSTVTQLTGAFGEMKQTGLSAELLCKASDGLRGNTGKKAKELSYVFQAYEALLKHGFAEENDRVRLAEKLVWEKNLFADTVFFADDFRGFTVVQMHLLSALITKSEDCFLSVFAENLIQNEENEAYTHALVNARSIVTAVKMSGVRVREENTDTQNDNSEMANLRKNFFRFQKEKNLPLPQNIRILCASQPKEECDMAAIEILRLLKRGYRCRDIGVLERTDTYAPLLTASLKKYGIPVFEDKRQPLDQSPLVRFILAAVSVCAKGFDTELLLNLIKTGMNGVSSDNCSLLEEYAFRWQISFSKWETPFTGHPDGFGNTFDDESRERLQKINALRELMIVPLIELRERLRQNNAQASCVALFEYLQKVGANEHFRFFAEKLLHDGEETRASECAGVWDTVTEALNALYVSLAGRNVTPQRFAQLVTLLLSAGTKGGIPVGIDEIIIGRADRTRFTSAKVILVVGCNEGIFPRVAQNAGIFNPMELRKLADNGFSLESLPENRYAEERLTVMQALFSPEDALFLSYSQQTEDGAPLQKSEIITETEDIFKGIPTQKAEAYTVGEKVLSFASAFEEYAKINDKTTPTAMALKKALESDRVYAERLKILQMAGNQRHLHFENPAISQALFGESIYFSASKAECYHKCPFMFFCRYGIGAERTRYSTVDARINGLLVHKVLEDVLGEYTSAEIAEKTREELAEIVREKAAQFEKESLSGIENLTGQVRRELERSENRITEILCRIASEFHHCAFRTVAVEMKIGGDGAEIPYYVLQLPNGGRVTLGGSIDRVDAMKTEDGTYLRVIDYKTGGKEFKLSDVFEGLSMQMLLYLFALLKNGKKKFSKPLPAGILYVPANMSGKKLDRNADEEKIKAQKLENGRMNGLLLENAEVIKGMEAGARGIYIDAKIDDNGDLVGKFLTLDEFARLNKKIDEILIQTALDIQQGKTDASPLASGGKSTCEFCDYASVCLMEDPDRVRTPLNMKHGEAVAFLNSEVITDE